MNKVAALLFIALTCISGCRNVVRHREEKAQFAPTALPERTSAKCTSEFDPASMWFPRPSDGGKERLPLPSLVSEATAQQDPGGEESARKQGLDSPLFCLFSDEMCHLSNSDEDRPTWLLDEAHGQEIDTGFIPLDLRNEWAASAVDRQQPLAGDPWAFRFATNYRLVFDSIWIGGKRVTVGISEAPFNRPTAVNAFLKVPQGKHGAWLFGLSYPATGKQAHPVPSIEYIWQPSERIRAKTGLLFPNMDDVIFDFSFGIRR